MWQNKMCILCGSHTWIGQNETWVRCIRCRQDRNGRLEKFLYNRVSNFYLTYRNRLQWTVFSSTYLSLSLSLSNVPQIVSQDCNKLLLQIKPFCRRRRYYSLWWHQTLFDLSFGVFHSPLERKEETILTIDYQSI